MKVILLSVAIACSSLVTTAQTMKELVNGSEHKVTWLGIDYSHVKLIGDFNQFAEAGASGPQLVKDKYFSGWNELIIKEYKKYDLQGAFRKDSVYFKIGSINKINAATPIESMEADEEPNYSTDDIKSFVKDYNYTVNEGFGLLLVCEYMNKLTQKAKYHLVVYNLSSKEIIHTEAFVGIAGGFGLRSYWAKPYFEVIDQIKAKRFKAWKKEFGA
jgi:hypothetical protein